MNRTDQRTAPAPLHDDVRRADAAGATAAGELPGADPGRSGDRVLIGPHAPVDLLHLPWQEHQDGPLVAVSGGFGIHWERHALTTAREHGASLLSVRAYPGEILVGPLWSPGAATGCAGCAQSRGVEPVPADNAHLPARPTEVSAREAAGTPLHPPRPAGAWLPPSLRQLFCDLLQQEEPLLAPGELLSFNRAGAVRRHNVPRSFRCAVCGNGPDLRAGRWTAPPEPRRLVSRPAPGPLPDRGVPPFGLDPDRMRDALADPRFGPVLRIQRNGLAGMAMAESHLLGGMFPGHGRGTTFRHAEPVAVLEAYERIGGFPHVAPIVFDATVRQLGYRAMDLSGLGRYTERQLASPLSRLLPFDDDTPMDWVWGHRLDTGAPLLVPADVGFYQYRRPADPDEPESTRRGYFFHESSSGSALGGSYEEATLHSLLELGERDAFLLAWHCRKPLPRIALTQITDRECLLLIRQIEDQGYDVHLLAATADLGIPVVWVMALRPDGRMPTCHSSAGSSPDPVQAVRAGLWEVSQMVRGGLNWDVEALRPAVADPWLVDELFDHHRRYAYPELQHEIEPLLGGPVVSLAEAFPSWPGVFTDAARGDVTEALRFVEGLFRGAGLEQIVVVDQSTPEHTAAGLSAVKAVVPGILPMCFGQAQQRLLGLPRLAAALADAHGTPPRDEDFPFDPHPFP